MKRLLFPDKYDWHECDAVQFDPEKLSGCANVEVQRMFADGVLDCFLSGQTVGEIVDDYGVRREAVEKILAFAVAKGFMRAA
jgi:uncharacterized protein (DUF433 family)